MENKNKSLKSEIKSYKEEIKYLKDELEKCNTYIHQLRGALGYAVPGYVPENPHIKNGIAEALSLQLIEAKKSVSAIINKDIRAMADIARKYGK